MKLIGYLLRILELVMKHFEYLLGLIDDKELVFSFKGKFLYFIVSIRIKLILCSFFNDHLSNVSAVHKFVIAAALDRYPLNITAEISVWKNILKEGEYGISKFYLGLL
jgi:hypothetical protein